MLHLIDGYTEREAKEMVGKRITQIDDGNPNHNTDAKKGVVLAHDVVQLKPGVQEHCVWVQWDGSDKAHLFGKLNEGKDFQLDGNTADKTHEKGKQEDICPSGMPASKQQIEAYKKLLSNPQITNEPTPFGSVNNSYDPHRDRKIMAAIRSTEAKLEEKKDKAMASFNEKSNEQHLRTRFNQSSGMSM